MFKKESGLSNFNEAETIIGESVQVKGNFESNGHIVINGILNVNNITFLVMNFMFTPKPMRIVCQTNSPGFD